ARDRTKLDESKRRTAEVSFDFPHELSLARKSPQGLRRPRFSFFRSTISNSKRWRRNRQRRLPDDRRASNPLSSSKLPDEKPRNGDELRRCAIAPRRRRTVVAVYRPRQLLMSTIGAYGFCTANFQSSWPSSRPNDEAPLRGLA